MNQNSEHTCINQDLSPLAIKGCQMCFSSFMSPFEGEGDIILFLVRILLASALALASASASASA